MGKSSIFHVGPSRENQNHPTRRAVIHLSPGTFASQPAVAIRMSRSPGRSREMMIRETRALLKIS